MYLSVLKFRIFFKLSNRLRISLRLLSNDPPDIHDIVAVDSEYDNFVETHFRLGDVHNCFIIQPYVKWGPKKIDIRPQEQLEEATALIKTLPLWTVEQSLIVPLESLEKKSLFKSGNMEKISSLIKQNKNITAVFINHSHLKKITNEILYENFQIPILDRYKIVMQILKIHATSKHAQLQVALAELYYIQRKVQTSNIFFTRDPETLKLMFHEREQKLKNAIADIRAQRNLLRNKRRKIEYPTVAVIGYTNSGKTSVIKALTGEESLRPRDQLFATLDVTVHSGFLPSGLEILYVDTVGFLSDLPTNLIECFIATLEDAILADIILHVEDVSSSAFEYKRKHVLTTLKKLGIEMGAENILNKTMSVGNKCDLNEKPEAGDLLLISAKSGTGLETLRTELENRILKTTGRQKITIKVPNGGDEIRWLHKNAVVLNEIADNTNPEILHAKVIVSQSNLSKFKKYFIQ